MIKKFYFLGWLSLAGAALVSIANGSMHGLQLVAFSLIALALIYAMLLWSVLVNTPHPTTE